MANKTTQIFLEYITKDSGLRNAIKQQEVLKKSLEGLNDQFAKNAKINNSQVSLYEKGRRTYADFSSTITDVDGKMFKVNRTFEIQREQIRKNGKFTGEFRERLVEVAGSLEVLATSARKTEGVFANLRSRFGEIVKRALLTVPAWQLARAAMDGIGFAINSTIQTMNQLDTAVRKVSTVFEPFQRTSQLTEDLRKSFKDLAISTGESIESIGNSAANIARAGLAPEQTLQALDAAVKLRLTSGASEEGITKALVLAYNLYGEEIRDAAEGNNEFLYTAALFNKIANANIDSVEGFINAFRTFSPVAKTAGLSLNELAALITGIQNAGFLDAQAGTILNRLFTRSSTQIEEFQKVITNFSNGAVQLTGKESPLQLIITLFDTLAKSAETPEKKIEAIFTLLGEKGIKGSVLIEQLPDIIQLMNDLAKSTEEPTALIQKFAERSDIIAKGTEQTFKSLSPLIGSVGQNLFTLVTGANDFNSAMLGVKSVFKAIEETIERMNKSTGIERLIQRFAFGGVIGGFSELLKQPEQQKEVIKKSLADEKNGTNSNLIKAGEDAAAEFSKGVSKFYDGTFKSDDIASTSKIFEKFFAFDTSSFEKIQKLFEENILFNPDKMSKVEIANRRYASSLNLIRKELGDIGNDLSDEFLTELIQKKPEDIQKDLFALGLDKDNGVGDKIAKALELLLIFKSEQAKADNDKKIREADLAAIQLDRLKALGFSERELAELKLNLYDDIDNADEQRHKKAKARLEAEAARILEITEAIKNSFQSNFESLFKNEITPSKFLGNIGDTFQNQSISSSARLATEAVLGTGIAAQFAEAIDATEQNPIVRSFIEGARRAAPILAAGVAGGAIGQTGINTGDVTGEGGIRGILGSLFGSIGFGQKGGKIGPPTQTQALTGGFLNAGLTGVLTGFAASQRGGKTAGLLGGAGGFLTSGFAKGGALTSLLPALGPVGLLAGAGLTIASFFSKSKKTESRTEESLISIAPKIDVSNKKLELINRNLVALKNVMEIYVLPQSAYLSESRNIGDQFSINSRRGLI